MESGSIENEIIFAEAEIAFEQLSWLCAGFVIAPVNGFGKV